MLFKKRKKRKFLDELKYGHLSEDAKLQKLLIKAITNGKDEDASAILKQMVERRAAIIKNENRN